MVPREKRATRSDFSTGYPQSRVSTEHFSATIKAAETSRFSVIVSKKVLASAVARNKLRRRVAASMLDTPLLPSLYLVYAKKGAGQLSYAEISSEIRELLDRLYPSG